MRRAITLATLAFVASCASRQARPFNPPVGTTHADAPPPPSDTAFAQQATAPPGSPDQVGLATWYGKEFAGKKTSNGERFDPNAMTAAHRKLPFNTWVEVRRVDTGTSVRVRITDRGPWGDDRKIIDLSREAAKRLGMLGEGVVRVELRVVRGPE